MWTDEQLKAINEKNADILVAAAAGSGKTAVLVERIIRIISDVENPVDIDRLLVLTFTKAAAAQMRERIERALSKKLEEQPGDNHIKRQLALISRAQITTIDSFCLKIVKENYMHINLDPAVRTADEKECDLIKSDILEELFEDKYGSEDNGEFLKLVEIFSEASGDNNLKKLILSIYDFVQSSPFPEQWLDEAAENFNIDVNTKIIDTVWGKVIFNAVINAFNSLSDKCMDMVRRMESEGTLPDSYINAVYSDMAKINSIKSSVLNDFDKAVDEIKNIKYENIGRIKAGEHDKEFADKIKAEREDIKKRMKSIASDYMFFYEEDMLEDIRAVYSVSKELTETVKEFSARFKNAKREKSVLDFSDMEHYALEILLEEGSAVRKPIPSKAALNFQEKYFEVMTDEYQDSNMVQEMILSAISGNKHNRFMVGDVKQSIYGFRQAEPGIFMDKFNSYNGEYNKVRIDLFKNFRSRENILNGINMIFSQIMGPETGGIEYDGKTALYYGADFPAFKEEERQKPIELYIIDRAEHDDPPQEAGEEEELDTAQLEMAFVANKIREMIDGRFKVYDGRNKYRDIKYGDIVILLRAAKGWGNAAAEALTNAGIPVFAPTQSPYFENTEIALILSILRVVDNSRQDIPLMAALKGPVYGVTDDELVKIKLYGGYDDFYDNVLSYAGKEERDIISEKLNMFLNDITRWKHMSEFTPVSSLLWTIYNETGYFDYIGVKENGIQRQANLRLLIQKAENLENTNFRGLFNFIRYIEKLEKFSEDNSEAAVLSENEDLVRITTIHKSKGLEYPVVFLCGLGKKFNESDFGKQVLMERNLGFGLYYTDIEKRVKYKTISRVAIKEKLRNDAVTEEMRVLYVGLTRAKEKLILTASSGDAYKFIEKSSLYCGYGDMLFPSYSILGCRSYIEWIMAALVRHKKGCEFLDNLGIKRLANFSDAADRIYNHVSNWEIKLVNKEEITSVKNNLDKTCEAEEKYEDSQYASELLEFKYHYSDYCGIPANVSVSEIKRRHMADLDRKDAKELIPAAVKGEYKKPWSFAENSGLTFAQRGTALHTVLEHIVLKNDYSKEDLIDVIKMLNKANILSDAEAESIKPDKILKFLESEIGAMLKCAEEIYQEESFAMELTPYEVYGSDIYTGIEERILIHGIIDCFFIYKGKVILYDYKTDYVPSGNENTLIDKYRIQLELYKKAVERSLGRNVDEVYIYSFFLDKALKVF